MGAGLQIITMAKMTLGWMVTGDGQQKSPLPHYSQPNPDH